jgi:hypothetical protein
MAAVTRVIGPVERGTAQWAAGLNAPAAGRIALLAPPGDISLTALLGVVLGAMGKPASANPVVVTSEEMMALAEAWLRAHRIDRVVLVHGDWLTRDVASGFAGLLDGLGIDLAYVMAGDVARDPFSDRLPDEMRWVDLVECETRAEGERARLASDPVRNQLDPLPRIGMPAGLAEVQRWSGSRVALVAQADLGGRLQRDGHFERATARSLWQVLRQVPAADMREAAAGAAAALALEGWSLRYDPAPLADDEAAPRWRDLRTGIRPLGPAIVGLLAAGLWAQEVADVRTGQLAPDGSTVTVEGRSFQVPPGAQAYLVAQRLLVRDPAARLIDERGRRMSVHAVATTGSAVLAEAGVIVEPGQLRRPATHSLGWLAERGLVLHRREGAGPPTRTAQRCRHGVPPTIIVDGVLVEHSRSLCKDDGSADMKPMRVRPPRYFTLEQTEHTDLGVRYAVSRPDGPAGELVGIYRAADLLWLQVGVGVVPALISVRAALAADYPASLEGRRPSRD